MNKLRLATIILATCAVLLTVSVFVCAFEFYLVDTFQERTSECVVDSCQYEQQECSTETCIPQSNDQQVCYTDYYTCYVASVYYHLNLKKDVFYAVSSSPGFTAEDDASSWCNSYKSGSGIYCYYNINKPGKIQYSHRIDSS